MKILLSTILFSFWLNITYGQPGWVLQSSGVPFVAYCFSVHFTDSNTGWIVGWNGIILKTTNGGTTWTEQTSGPSQELHSVHFEDINTGWAVGDDGTILKTIDGGTTWTPQTSGMLIDLYSVYFTDTNTGWAVGNIILKTTNGGTNWILQIGATNGMYSVQFADYNSGWIVGQYGTILRTTNGGTNWTPQTSGTSDWLYSVYFTDISTGWAVGYSGTILKSTNGGANWLLQTSGTSNWLSSVHFTDTNTGWAVGNSGTILKTTNGGTIWTPQASGTGSGLLSVYFTGNNTGWAVGVYSTILKTTTGGEIDCTISGPSHIPIGSTDNLYESNVPGGFWTLSNYDGTNASLASGNNSNPVSVNAGYVGGHFVLYYNFANVVLCSKHLYVDDPQPVELVSFAFDLVKNDVVLKWTTVSELDNSRFEIQRSSTDIPWTAIGFVPGAHISTEPRNYSYEDKNLESGIYHYRLKQIDFNGNFEYFDLPEAVTIGVPEKFFIDQNYPNPFNPMTTIAYGIPQSGNVVLKIFDMAGREIKTLLNEFKDAGYYVAKFDGSSLASGTYIYRIESGSFVSAKKMLLLK